MINPSFWQGRRVWISGHTGFKGSWLCLTLHALGARVYGASLPPPTHPAMFDELNIAKFLARDDRLDVRDAESVKQSLNAAQPDVVIHMAAQPLVREGYRDPVTTFASNVMGTVHVLEAARNSPNCKVALMVTTDKVYKDNHHRTPYQEKDQLGGHDPYAASKAAAELAVLAYIKSYTQNSGPVLLSARAGNVIGGGDFAADRLIPDAYRAAKNQQPLTLRMPKAIRPWQHVMDPLLGYLALIEAAAKCRSFQGAWNFGPDYHEACDVETVAQAMSSALGLKLHSEAHENYEAPWLHLDSSKAKHELGWQPVFTTSQALAKTAEWYGAFLQGKDTRQLTQHHIQEALKGAI